MEAGQAEADPGSHPTTKVRALAEASFPYVVVGAGISGLYCTLRLASEGKEVLLLEALSDLGGRIQTRNLAGFNAEFGPMRFEPAIQPLFLGLKKELKVGLSRFSSPQAELPEWPKYSLANDEKTAGGDPLNSLELLQLGILRVLGRDGSLGASIQMAFLSDLSHPPLGQVLASGDVRSPEAKQLLTQWFDRLSDEDYYNLRRYATYNTTPLRNLRLWNVLSDELSHQAVLKIRDQGTFYHLIPENPSAIEWIIFWLRALHSAGGKLKTVKGGVSTIIQKLEVKLGQQGAVTIVKRAEVVALAPDEANGMLRLTVRETGAGDQPILLHARRVILAMPRSPLKRLAEFFPEAVRQDLDSVIGFPLLKVFFVTRAPWWGHRSKPQRNASTMPTREVHYWRRDTKPDDGFGLVMLYMDRPATEYWNHYVTSDSHTEPEIDKNEELKTRFVKYLARDVQEKARAGFQKYLGTDVRGKARAAVWLEQRKWLKSIWRNRAKLGLPPMQSSAGFANVTDAFALLRDAFARVSSGPESVDRSKALRRLWLTGLPLLVAGGESDVSNLIASSVVTYGIRDWGREPFGAACHAWKARRNSWEVIDRLSAFPLGNASGGGTVHICGEAYSDYQGFIEGALRSAEKALRAIRELESATAGKDQ